MEATNPFAPPARKVPTHTSWSLWAMGSEFRVGEHTVSVETEHWTGRERYLVDGVLVRESRNLGWHAAESLRVGGSELQIVGRWYPVRPVEVWVGAERVVDDLFPQVAWLKLLLLVTAGPLFLGLVGGILHDLVGMGLLLPHWL